MELTTYALADGVATITLDDGKVNALSRPMLASISADLDRAAADEAIVVLTGRATTLSAGFDLRCPPEEFGSMVLDGARLAEKLLSHPHPTIAACNGNAIAMGAFLLLSVDHRIGVDGPFTIALNEVAIGLTLPWFGIELARHRLNNRYFDRCTITGAMLAPAEAQLAGFLDSVVAPDELDAGVAAQVQTLAGLNRTAHTNTKLRVREQVLAGVRDGIDRLANREPAEW